jgi:hypothetical protein
MARLFDVTLGVFDQFKRSLAKGGWTRELVELVAGDSELARIAREAVEAEMSEPKGRKLGDLWKGVELHAKSMGWRVDIGVNFRRYLDSVKGTDAPAGRAGELICFGQLNLNSDWSGAVALARFGASDEFDPMGFGEFEVGFALARFDDELVAGRVIGIILPDGRVVSVRLSDAVLYFALASAVLSLGLCAKDRLAVIRE